MHVLQVAPQYPPNVGGVETHVAELSEGLVRIGHDVTVVTADAGPDVAARTTRNGVTVRRHLGLAPDDAFHIAPTIAKSVRRLQSEVDVVHAHNYHALPLLFAAFAVSDVPLVATPHYHGESANSVRDHMLTAYRFVGGPALQMAETVIAVSDWERARLRDDFGVNAQVVPNGIEVERFAGADPFDHDRPYLLTVGRLEQYKGIQHAIKALGSLPEYDLLIAGDGPYRDNLERLAADVSYSDRITFLGYVSNNRLPGLYAGATAYVALSTLEAFGLSVGEALAAGTPCVVLEARALADWTNREDCVGVADTKPNTVADAVHKAAGRDAPSGSLPTWDNVTRSVADVYSDCVAGSFTAE